MAYNVTKFNKTPLITIMDGSVNDSVTDIKLLGKGVTNYGEIMAENLVWMLENFASDEEPTKPLVGQIWYDTNRNAAFVCKGRKSISGEVDWRPLGGATISDAKPQGPQEGDQWWDEGKNRLYAYDGETGKWVLIGPPSVKEVKPESDDSSEGELWWDGSSNQLYGFDEDVGKWILIGPSAGGDVSNLAPGAVNIGVKLSTSTELGTHEVVIVIVEGNVVAAWADAVIRWPDNPEPDEGIVKITIDRGNDTGGENTLTLNMVLAFPSGLNPGLNMAVSTNHINLNENDINFTNEGDIKISNSGDSLNLYAPNQVTSNVKFISPKILGAATVGQVGLGFNGFETTGFECDGSTVFLRIGDTRKFFVNDGETRFHENNLTDCGHIYPESHDTKDLGTASNSWRDVYGTAMKARYADLAERYKTDCLLESGDVVKIGGDNEITKTYTEFDEDVFGVISTQPAYCMNNDAGDNNTHPYVALSGKVPVKCIGTVQKGQRLVSSVIPGVARAITNEEAKNNVLAIIGRALEDKVLEDVEKVMVSVNGVGV